MTAFFPPDILKAAESVLAKARAKKLLIATAESCTGGLIAAALTEIPGSSDVFDRGFVTYSNKAKAVMLKVPTAILRKHGAVSEKAARAMATGALKASGASIAVAVTGIAGPGGGSPQKPVGLVHFAIARKGAPPHTVERRFGDLGRTEVRLDTVRQAFAMLAEEIDRV
ncbi:MAG TPA: CinA family protein [Alphaproteobacteria bacterium]|nr:CinA family protein [Alphaproteobacteria bacterium]